MVSVQEQFSNQEQVIVARIQYLPFPNICLFVCQKKLFLQLGTWNFGYKPVYQAKDKDYEPI